MAISSQGCTFTFKSTTYTVTNVSVRAPTPEIVNMTPATAGNGEIHMVSTGDYTSPGVVEVDALGFSDPKESVGQMGPLVFQGPGGSSVQAPNAICSDASAEARVGDLLRIRMTFTLTDYQG